MTMLLFNIVVVLVLVSTTEPSLTTGTSKLTTGSSRRYSKHDKFLQFELIPSTANVHSRRKLVNDFPKEWFHPNVRAVYATLHPSSTINDTDNNPYTTPEYQDFVNRRHLSRYERHLRTRLGWDLSYFDMHNHGSNATTTSSGINTAFNSSSSTQSFKNRRRRQSLASSSSSSNSNNSLRKQQNQKLDTMDGGQFNEYQGIPLSQGYGTHYIHIWVGSPIPQRQTVIVDTGSHYTAFPCSGCSNCGQQHHTDPEFSPAKSQTFEYVKGCEECANDCQVNQQASQAGSTGTISQSQQQPELPYYYCPLTQAYTEGSSWKAIQAKDGLYCGGTDILEAADPIDRQFSIPFMFGCLQQSSGLFVTQLANGIMGLSAHDTTLPKQLYDAGLLEYNMFALCFRKELRTSKRGITAGTMTLGGSSSALDRTPMIYAKNVVGYGWFTVKVRNVYMMPNHHSRSGNDDSTTSSPSSSFYSSLLFDTAESIQSVHSIVSTTNSDKILEHINSGKGVIVDSGTTDTYLSPELLPEFSKYWKQVVGAEYSDGPLYLTKNQLRKLPTLLIQCEGANSNDQYRYDLFTKSSSRQEQRRPQPIRVGEAGMLDRKYPKDLILAIPASNYMEYNAAFNVYTSRLYFTESSGGVIGANAMQGHSVVFDWQHGRIGFSHSTCDYDLIQYQKKRQKTKSESNNAKDDGGIISSFFGGGGSGGGLGLKSSECILDDVPILSKSCQVDATVCYASDNPDNVSIVGYEIWTWVIDSPGREIESCHKVLTEWTLRQHLDLDPSIIDCTHEGVCTEQRPCEMPCLRAMSIKKHNNSEENNDEVTQPTGTETKNHMTKMASSELNTDLGRQQHTDHDENESAERGDLEGFSCSDSVWSSCDFGCKQSRVVSRASASLDTLRTTRLPSEKNVCIEVNRESRGCHVDACGRSDPCLVPFLVHTILVLEGSTNYDDDLFRREFTKAVHLPEYSSIADFFEEGDLDILSIRPWYRADDEYERYEHEGIVAVDKNESQVNMPSGSEDELDNPIGIQIVLQVSIFNPQAQRLKPESESKHRTLLQEIGVLWTNITKPFQDPPPPLSICDLSDIYPLAQDAAEVAYKILTHTDFGSNLVKNMPLYHTARVVSSWTVSTQVVDKKTKSVYPLATITPSIFLFRAFLETSLLITLVAALSLIAQVVVQFMRWYGASRPLKRKWCQRFWLCCKRRTGQYYYDPLKEDNGYNTDEDDCADDSSLDAKIMGTPQRQRRSIQIELPNVHAHSELDRHRSNTKATKRKISNPLSPHRGVD